MKTQFFTLYSVKQNFLRAPLAPMVRHFQGGGGSWRKGSGPGGPPVGVMLVQGTLCGRPSSLHKHTQKSKRTQTEALRTQNGRERTSTHIKTDANAMYGA